MNKSAFIKVLEQAKEFHAGAEFRVTSFIEDAAELAKWKAMDPKYPWVAFATTLVVNECWYITVVSHKSEEAMTKLVAAAERWLAEWLEAAQAAEPVAVLNFVGVAPVSRPEMNRLRAALAEALSELEDSYANSKWFLTNALRRKALDIMASLRMGYKGAMK